jgi:hypothetical protein
MRFNILLTLFFMVAAGACGDGDTAMTDTTPDPSDLGSADVSAPDVPSGHVQLSVFKTGDGGVVRSIPAGIECGNACFAEFPVGSTVALRPTPEEGHRFMGFGGACQGLSPCTVTMDAKQEVGVTWKAFQPNLAWSVLSSSDGQESLSDVAVTPSGDWVAVGRTSATSLSWNGTPVVTSPEVPTFFLTRMGADGAFQWQRHFVEGTSCGPPLVATDASGNAIVAGFAGEDTDLSGNLSVPSHGSGTFIAQFSPTGDLNWFSIFEGGCIHALSVNNAGEVAITGQVNQANANYGGDDLASSDAAYSAFVAVFEPTGLNRWARVFATSDLDVAKGNDILLDADGGVTLAAFFQNTGSVSFGGEVLPNGVASVVARYDAQGAHQYSTPFGGVYSHITTLAARPEGGVYVAGWESPGAAQENFVALTDSSGMETERYEFHLEEKQEPVAVLPFSGGLFYLGRMYNPLKEQANFFLIRLTDAHVPEYYMEFGAEAEDVLTGAAIIDDADLILVGHTNSASFSVGETAITNEGGGKESASRAMVLRVNGL